MCDICFLNPLNAIDGTSDSVRQLLDQYDPTSQPDTDQTPADPVDEPEDTGAEFTAIEVRTVSNDPEPGTQTASPTVGTTFGTASQTSPILASLSEMGTFLSEGFWPNTRKWNLTDEGTHAKNGVLTYTVGGSARDGDGLSADRADMAREVVKLYEAATGIDFQEVSGVAADITFFDNEPDPSGKVEFTIENGTGIISSGGVGIPGGLNNGLSDPGTYAFTLAVHEFGHVMGLGHLGEYPLDTGQFLNDSFHVSVMSYNVQEENPYVNASSAIPLTLMAADLLGLDHKYAADGYGTDDVFSDNTVWGFNTTITDDQSAVLADLATYAQFSTFTIHDTGGIDTIDFSGFTLDQVIDLTPTEISDVTPTASSLGSLLNNMTLSVGTVIENAIGGVGNDRLKGNDADNRLVGNAGNDILFGGLGDDDLIGGWGLDLAVFEGAVGDYQISDINGQLIVIGDGRDTVASDVEQLQFSGQIYTRAQLEPIIAAQAPTAQDDLFTIGSGEILSGNLFADNGSGQDSDPDGLAFAVTGVADAGPGTYTTALGGLLTIAANGQFTYVAPTVDQSLGAWDTVLDSVTYEITATDGGMSGATARFRVSGVNDAPVAQDIAATVSEDSFATLAAVFTDPDLTDFHIVTLDTAGTLGMVTNNLDGTFDYDPGFIFDTLEDGETATDTFRYTVTDFFGGTSTATVTMTIEGISGAIEGQVLVGTAFGDVLTGSAGDDNISGEGAGDTIDGDLGNDTINGGAGLDTIDGGEGDDVIDGGDGGDNISGGKGRDVITGGSGFDTIDGGDGDDIIDGGVSGDMIDGGAGNDQISGGDGSDSLSGGLGDDTLDAGEGYNLVHGDEGNDILIGGSQIDSLFGGADYDDLQGNAGNDSLSGDAGNDTLDGGSGNDRLSGGTGTDVLRGGTGRDELTGGADADRFVFQFGDGYNQITDFEYGIDKIDLSAMDASFADIAIWTRNGTVVIYQDVRIGVDSAAPGTLGVDDFIL